MTYTHPGQDLSVSYGDLLVIFPQSPSHFPLGFHHSRVVLVVKNLPVNAEDIRNAGSILGSGRFPQRRAWQHIPVFLSMGFHGQRNLAGYRVHGVPQSQTRLQLLSTHAHHHSQKSIYGGRPYVPGQQ